MQNIIITLNQARARAKVHAISEHLTNTAELFAMLAYDIVTDQYPENNVRLIGRPAQAYAAQEFEFTVQA